MKRIDVKFDGAEYVFRTNDSGDYLFIGVSENRQISCESGFNSLRRVKQFIREYLRGKWEMKEHGYVKFPRVSYFPSPYREWKP